MDCIKFSEEMNLENMKTGLLNRYNGIKIPADQLSFLQSRLEEMKMEMDNNITDILFRLG